MSATPWVPQVSQIVDGQQVSAEVVNPITDQLVQRDQYLFEKFSDANDLSVLTAFNQPIHPDEIAAGTIVAGPMLVGYYANDVDGQGIRRAVIDITASQTQSIFTPQNSCYPMGIITNVTGGSICDLWISGLVNLPYNLDDPVNGLTQPISDSAVEAFQVGPYYLSQTYPGKITSNPNGVQVYVGYAVTETQILINPNVNQLGQLFVNYKFNVLDRPTAAPVLQTISGSNGVANGTTTFTSSGATFSSLNVGNNITITGRGTYEIISVNSATSIVLNAAVTTGTGLAYTVSYWTIPSSDMTRLGWVDVAWLQNNNPSALSGYIIPQGALFLYNVPSTYTTDNADNTGAGSLDTTEKAEATDLAQTIPPQPADFSNLTVNGIVQIYLDEYNPNGIYSVDNFGIWWYSNTVDSQPWSSALADDWTPANWPTTRITDLDRVYVKLTFAKFNPDFSQAIVTSLAAFNDGSTNNSTSSLQFVDKRTGVATNHGDLLAKFNLAFAADATVTASPTAISTFTYNQITGQVQRTLAPIVSTLTAVPGSGATITESPANSGNFLVSFQSQGITGQVYDLQPENSELINLSNSLHTYLRFPYTTQAITYGVLGKIVLPEQFPANQNLYIILHMIGLGNGASTQQIGYNFSYNVSTVVNGAGPAAVLAANSTTPNNTLVLNDTVATPFQIPMGTTYVAQQAFKYKSTSLMIPAANIGPDSIVNFRLTRYMFGNSTDYTSDIGLLAVYWSIAPV